MRLTRLKKVIWESLINVKLNGVSIDRAYDLVILALEDYEKGNHALRSKT